MMPDDVRECVECGRPFRGFADDRCQPCGDGLLDGIRQQLLNDALGREYALVDQLGLRDYLYVTMTQHGDVDAARIYRILTENDLVQRSGAGDGEA